MQERLRRQQQLPLVAPAERTAPGRAPAEQESAEAPTVGMVGVLYGPMMLDAPVANMTVGEAAELLRSTLNLPADAIALVDGHEVDSGQRLTTGARLEFVRSAGEKGAQLR